MKYHRENYNITNICPLWTDYIVYKFIEETYLQKKYKLSILEFGCATGYIGKFLKDKFNCIITGIDKDREALKVAQKYYDAVYEINLNENDFAEKLEKRLDCSKYDIILCMSVLEHLIEPEKILFNIKKYIKEDGFVIVCLPNIAFWAIRLKLLLGNFDYEKGLFGTDHGKGIVDNTHLRFFTLKTARQMLVSTGYKIEKLDFDPDKGIPKFHSLILKLPNGWKLLKKIYSILPRIFAFQFIFKLRL